MTEETSSAVIPGSVVWTLNSLRDPEQEPRTFAQRELSMEGESALIGLVMDVGAALKAAGYSFDRLATLLDDGPTDFDLLGEVISIGAASLPEIGTRAAGIFLGQYPTNLDGSPNAAYNENLLFLKGAMSIPRLIDMVRIYAAQNDYRRALRPFAQALGARMGPGSLPSGLDGALSDGGPQRLYGPDWRPPVGPTTQTPEETSPPANETESSSGPSTSSPPPATGRRSRSSGSTPAGK